MAPNELPEPKDESQRYYVDWVECWNAYQTEEFPLNAKEILVVQGHLHGYTANQIHHWVGTRTQYEQVLANLHKKWRPVELMIYQQWFPPVPEGTDP